MKTITFIFFYLHYSFIGFAQEKTVAKPEYVIVANNEIIAKERLEEYGRLGSIKAMNKGVSDEEWKNLVARFGEKIGERDFIIKIELLTKDDSAVLKKQPEKKIEAINLENELKLKLNDVASNFTVDMLDGAELTLSDFKGKVALDNFWATWCAPCLMEFTEFPDQILKPFSGKDFVFIPISIGESKETVQRKMAQLKKYGVNLNVGLDRNKKIWDQYATGSIPKSFVIDKNGTIRYISIGNADGSVAKLATEVKKLIE